MALTAPAKPAASQEKKSRGSGTAQTDSMAPTPDTALASVAHEADYARLLDALGFEPVDSETLVERSGLAIHEISSMLLILELQGEVATHAGGRYCRVR